MKIILKFFFKHRIKEFMGKKERKKGRKEIFVLKYLVCVPGFHVAISFLNRRTVIHQYTVYHFGRECLQSPITIYN